MISLLKLMVREGALISKLRRRVKTAHIKKVPSVLANVARRPPSTPSRWRNSVTKLVESFRRRFRFYHPVKCGCDLVSRPIVRGDKEIYKCPDGTRREFRRFMNPSNFFKYRYGRGGEFAQGLLAILKFLGYRARMALGYWGGRADVIFVEIWNPWSKRWIPLDPVAVHGYGHKFPKAHMKVWALEKATNKPVNRTKNYICKKGCLPSFAEGRKKVSRSR